MQSMTAFSRLHCFHEQYEWTWEIKTVNHRFLDVFFRLPDAFRCLEMQLRSQIAQKLSRGRVEVSFQFKSTSTHQAPRINQAAIAELISLAEHLSQTYQIPNDLSVQSCLNWPNIFESTSPEEQESYQKTCLQSFDKALVELCQTRHREGEAIAVLLQDRIHLLEQHLLAIENEMRDIPLRMKDKIQAKMSMMLSESTMVDAQRLEQELAVFLMRLDISEEVDRLNAHLLETKNTIEKKGAMGRRLDFLVQELHRETNTIGSKTDSTSIRTHSIEMKVIIEQMREQIQNVE